MKSDLWRLAQSWFSVDRQRKQLAAAQVCVFAEAQQQLHVQARTSGGLREDQSLRRDEVGVFDHGVGFESGRGSSPCSVLPVAPGSRRRPRPLCSPAPTKTRSTSSRPARPSAPSNCRDRCTSPPPRNRRRRWRRGPRRRAREPLWCTAPPLRSPRAPAQKTPPRSRARHQRLQRPRQTAWPSARPERSRPLARGFTLATTEHRH